MAPARRTRPRKPARPPAARSPTIRVAPVRIARPSSRIAALPEPPHTHLVCRVCARIIELPMEFDQQQTLESLLLRAPGGWMVDSITVSMTGGCPRCREGPPA